ncbi:hypothetical protein GCM10011519_01600 [Marmoricola endophyticus]|uniref:Cobalamin biosynthesis protein CobD n=1 Tax=Marmoricola endophyticus TaxID=2040280 RepID=A0A917F081_9ACTN|nr:hypothetical protein GCM10011519_01600 [Marmoricola endophyticus]
MHGAAHVAVLVGAAVALGLPAERVRPTVHAALTAAATWAVLGGTTLSREADAVDTLLRDEDLDGARQRLTHLVGRDPSELGPGEIARAVVESVAENTSDAVVAPLVWGAIGGVPGLLGYRAANTLDAMVGHRTPRLERFGWAAARLDDVLNLPGSRLSAVLAVLLGPDHAGACRAWHRDARAHPSPNAGPVEAAFAGALGVRLGGTNVYAGRTEHRAVLGDGRPVEARDIVRARTLADRVGLGAVVLSALAAGRARRRPR